MGVVGGAVIQALVAVEGRIGHRQQGGGGAQAEPAKGPRPIPMGQKENGEQETQDQAGRTQPHQPGQVQLIVSHDPPASVTRRRSAASRGSLAGGS